MKIEDLQYSEAFRKQGPSDRTGTSTKCTTVPQQGYNSDLQMTSLIYPCFQVVLHTKKFYIVFDYPLIVHTGTKTDGEGVRQNLEVKNKKRRTWLALADKF